MTTKTYLVGGFIRDRLLGLEAKDHDFVVVGATPEMMLESGFTQVGADFPVFLNKAGDEYALARTERKVAAGYHGFETDFDPSVTLREDLYRRDLTINAMAREVIDWTDEGFAVLSDEIIDPFLGQEDLSDGIIRHVSEAFGEDPVRVLRAARFAARYDFRVADQTIALMKQMVREGELDHLTSERIWLEMEKSMKGDRPGDFFRILESVGAVEVVMPMLAGNTNPGCAVDKVSTMTERFAVMVLGLGEEKVAEFFDSLKAPVHIKRAAVKTERWRRFVTKFGLTPATRMLTGEVRPAKPLTADAAMEIFNKLDVLRASDEFDFCVRAYDQIHYFGDMDTLMKAKDAYMSVSFGDIVDSDQLQGIQIAAELQSLRRHAIERVLT